MNREPTWQTSGLSLAAISIDKDAAPGRAHRHAILNLHDPTTACWNYIQHETAFPAKSTAKSEIIAQFCHAGCDMDGPCLRKQLLSRSKNVKVLLQLGPATSSNTIVEVITSFQFFSEAETREHSSKSKCKANDQL